ncbi:MAG TPA: outer membrane beta-barrel protein, partial [Allocoleopsis sp.]
YLLKAMGDYGSSRQAFEYAYACKKLDPSAAYINNWLARLHLTAGNSDSAKYYAQKAVTRAPNWACALSTLSLVQDVGSNKPEPKTKKTSLPQSGFGVTVSIGLNHSNPDFRPAANTTVTAASPRSGVVINGGLIYDVPVSQHLSIRPSASITYGITAVLFDVRNQTGGVTESKVDVKNSTLRLLLPLIVSPAAKKTTPYFLVGPSFDYVLHQDTASRSRLPLKNSLFLVNAGIGINLPISRSGMVLSPEIRFSQGISDMKDPAASTNYSNSLGALKKQEWTIGIVVRKR